MPSYYRSPKCKVEDCLRISIFSLDKSSLSKKSIVDSITFSYPMSSQENQQKEIKQTIYLTTTNCNFHGIRYWYICDCRKRVAMLYMPYFADSFKCRHCYNLTYESRNLSGKFKRIGNPLSFPELEILSKQVKRIFYNGKPTKKFIKYEKKINQFKTYHSTWLNNFYKNIKIK